MKGKPNAALAARIRELKDHCGISFAQLARAIGVTKTTAADYVNGKSHIPADLLLPMADAFGCEVRQLLAPPGSPPPAAWLKRRVPRRWGRLDGSAFWILTHAPQIETGI